MKNTIEIKQVKTDKRARLSIDLEAYPDVKAMLAAALRATGLTTTDITIEALRERLPDVVLKLERERALSTAEFLKIYPATGGKMPDPLRGNAGRVNQVVPDQIIPALPPPATIVPVNVIAAADATANGAAVPPAKQRVSVKNENPVNSKRARHLLAGCRECGDCHGRGCDKCGGTGWFGKPWGESWMSAIKTHMGIKGRFLFLSQVRQFLIANPSFKTSDVYPRKPKNITG